MLLVIAGQLSDSGSQACFERWWTLSESESESESEWALVLGHLQFHIGRPHSGRHRVLNRVRERGYGHGVVSWHEVPRHIYCPAPGSRLNITALKLHDYSTKLP
jgi:hypothetical protein